VTNDVLPLMRRSSIYSNNDEVTQLQKKINELEHLMKKNAKAFFFIRSWLKI
jgi:hypothetical protein